MGNGTYGVEHVRTRAKTRIRPPVNKVTVIKSNQRALLMRLMAEKLGVAKDDGMSLHEILEDNHDGIMEEYHAGPD